MDRLIYTAMTGAKHVFMQQAGNANNLANASTIGFKAQEHRFRAVPVLGEGMPTRAFTVDASVQDVFDEGPVMFTGRNLDVTVEGRGWLAVQLPDGSEAYARTASMNVDALGILRAGNGMPIMGNAGPIAVPPQQQIEVGEDGTISVRAMGEGPRVMAEVDRIKLVQPDLKNMTKGQDGLIHTVNGQPAPADANVRVTSGFLEASNVNAVEEMTSVLALSKQFELHIKMMNTAKEDDQAMTRVLAMS